MDAAVDDQELAERPVIGAGSRDRHAQSVVKIDLIALEKAGHRDTLDEQVQGIGYHVTKAAEKIAGRGLEKHASQRESVSPKSRLERRC
jgi:hypothetical protein